MRKKIEIALMGIFAIVLIIAIVKLGGMIVKYKEGRDTYKNLKEYVVVDDDIILQKPVKEGDTEVFESTNSTEAIEEQDTTVYYGQSPTVNFDGLKAQNQDVVAWIYAPGTIISYPIVQGTDNDYYLKHMFNGVENDCGSIFMEYTNLADFSDNNTFLYGHHMKDGSMFASIVKYNQQSYYDTHPVMWIETPDKSYKLEIFTGFYTTVGTSIWKIDFASDEEHQEWLNTIQKLSVFSSDVVPDITDKIVSLSTCTSGNYNESRFVVMGILREQ